jgi:hypothetical protein
MVVYYKKLNHIHPEAIEKGFDLAWKQHPAFFPSAAELFECIKSAEKNINTRSALPQDRQIEQPRDDQWSESGARKCKEIIDSLSGKMEA